VPALLNPKELIAVGLLMLVINTYLPFITGITITDISRHAGVWVIEGTITIDKTKIPEEYTRVRPEGWAWYNHDPDGTLPWWEEHINDILAEHGVRGFYVTKLELEWLEIGERFDIVWFHAELLFGSGRTKSLDYSESAAIASLLNAFA